MADHTGIEWTDATWNPVVGCSLVSPGCTHCYAMGQASRIVRCSEGLGRASAYDGTVETVKGKPVWTGKVALASEATLTQPLRWTKPRRIFVNSMGDLFHEDVPDEWIDRVFAVMALAPQHSFQILTKRSARMREYFNDGKEGVIEQLRRLEEYPAPPHRGLRMSLAEVIQSNAHATRFNLEHEHANPPWPLPNVWLGVSAEDQRRADERIPDLLATPAAIRFVSAEPLLGPIDFRQWQHSYGCGCGWGGCGPLDYCTSCGWRGHAREALGVVMCPECREEIRDHNACPECDGHDGDGMSFGPNHLPPIDWVIVGGESGKGARPMHPDWARAIRDQCAAAGTAFFFKQWGEWGFDPLTTDAKGPSFHRFDDGVFVQNYGKARSGRLLDGVTHDAMPEVRHG